MTPVDGRRVALLGVRGHRVGKHGRRQTLSRAARAARPPAGVLARRLLTTAASRRPE